MNFETLKNNLERNGFTVTCFATAEQAAKYLDNQIDNKTIGIGGSMTLEEIDIYDRLCTHNTIFWHQRLRDGKTSKETQIAAAAAQIYISSANGIAETGEIINIDGNCNRVSAILYGHEKVYLVVGSNKIAPDYDAALWRARNIAAPLNAKRLNRNTPCAKLADRCYNCQSPERICRSLSILWQKPTNCDYEIILIDEQLGY